MPHPRLPQRHINQKNRKLTHHSSKIKKNILKAAISQKWSPSQHESIKSCKTQKSYTDCKQPPNDASLDHTWHPKTLYKIAPCLTNFPLKTVLQSLHKAPKFPISIFGLQHGGRGVHDLDANCIYFQNYLRCHITLQEYM